MKETVNYAIVGCGSISKTHIKALAQVENAKLYAVCDKSAERAEAAAALSGAIVYTDLDEMLADKEVRVLNNQLSSFIAARDILDAYFSSMHK